MITRDTKDCKNPYKHHLYRLPDIPSDRFPPRYSTVPKHLLLIPLFSSHGDCGGLLHHITRSACWARRSWMLFSDAMELGVKIGFYVGDISLDPILPILEANAIDIDTDVFIFDESKLDGDPVTHLGKKLAVFNDTQFANYEWVFQADSDLFLASPSREKGVFFSYFTDVPREIGAVVLHTSVKKAIGHFHWWGPILGHKAFDEEAKVQHFLKKLTPLVDPDIRNAYEDASVPKHVCGGGLYAFPAKHFHANRPDDCKWIADAGKALQDDEAVFSVWGTKGKALFSVSELTGIRQVVDLDKFVAVHEQADPLYFSHLSNFNVEWVWRDGFDSL